MGRIARRGHPRKSAIFWDNSVFDVPGGPKKMADLGVFLLNGRPLATPSLSSHSGFTNRSQRKFFRDRGLSLPWSFTRIRLSSKVLANSAFCSPRTLVVGS